MEQYLPLDYFSNFFGVHVDQKVLDEIIGLRYPELAAHFQKVGFITELLSMSWFVQLLVNKMPIETVNLIWDLFLLDDIKQVFRAILTAISQLHDELLNLDRFDEILMTIQAFIADDFGPEMLINSLVPRISSEEFEALREKHRSQTLQTLKYRLDESRVRVADQDPRRQFMDKFFALGGLQHYYAELAKQTNSEEHRVAAKVLASNSNVFIPQLMRFYKCDLSWPICLYDFTHRNLNPKFNTLLVQAPLTRLLVDNYFSEELLSNRA